MIDLTNVYFLDIFLGDDTYKKTNSGLRASGVATVEIPDNASYNSPIKTTQQLFSSCGNFGYFKAIVQPKDIHRRRDIYADTLSMNNKQLNAGDLKDKSFYRTPNLDLPQMKVQNLKDKHNISITRKKDVADYIVTSDKYVENLFNWSYKDVYNIHEYKSYLEHIDGNINDEVRQKLNSLADYIESNDKEAHVYLSIRFESWNFSSQIKNVFQEAAGPLAKGGVSPYYCKDEEMFYTLQYASSSDQLVKDINLLHLCNEDSVVLAPKDCKTISDMINSNDDQSASLALEMMANCNVEASYDKIALIFAFYDHKLRYCSNWNHINVKSLRKTMKGVNSVDEGNSGHGFNTLVRHLKDKNVLTEFAVGAITNKMCKTVLKYVHLTSEGSVFDVKASDLKLKSEFSVSDDLPF
tara:strand:- start:6128 stop:7357 length:1230 start_codon:yes stop_codon:yes gene_type:complete